MGCRNTLLLLLIFLFYFLLKYSWLKHTFKLPQISNLPNFIGNTQKKGKKMILQTLKIFWIYNNIHKCELKEKLLKSELIRLFLDSAIKGYFFSLLYL